MSSTMRSFIREMPKAELHMHLEGALEPELAFKFAQRNHVKLRFTSIDELRSSLNFTDLQSFLDLYYENTSTLITKADFTELTLSYLRHAADDHVRHAELFFDPQSHTSRGISFETLITGIDEALATGARDYNVSTNLIMCFLRHLSEDDASATLEEAMPFRRLFFGVGLDSSENGNPPSKFERVCARARAAGLHVVAHAGEEGPPDYIRQALDLLYVERIDHGVRILEDEGLTARVVREQVALTVCPLSNVKLRVFPSIQQHNLKRLIDAGLKVMINSDDPAYFGGYVADNYIAVQETLGLDRDDLHQLAANSFEASFISAARKQSLLQELDRYFATHCPVGELF